MNRFSLSFTAGIPAALLLLAAWAYSPGSSPNPKTLPSAISTIAGKEKLLPGRKSLQKAVEQNPGDRNLRLEYAQECFNQSRYAEAYEQWKAADDMESITDAETLYSFAACAAQLRYGGRDNGLLARAVQEGFADYDRLLEDRRLEPWRQQSNFWHTYTELFYENGAAIAKGLWAFFPKAKKERYVLSINDLYKKNKTENREIVPYNFDRVLTGVSDAMFSRGGGDNFFPEMAYRHTKNYYAVIYVVEVPWTDEEVLPHTYRLATFDLQGKPISDVKLAHRNMASCQTVELQGSEIRTQYFEIEYDNGQVRTLSSGKTTTMTIQDDGTIVTI